MGARASRYLEELVGDSAYEFLHPEDIDDVRGAHSTLLNGGERVDVRYRHRHKSGSYFEWETLGPGRFATRRGR